MSNPNAWNYFEQNHYQRFQDVCLNNPKEYGVARFADPDVNKKLKKDSEFIEIYHNDAQRTPCIVIETQKKISSIKDNDIYETQSHHYLYGDHNFLSQFGLDLLTNFDTTAGNLRENIINGTHPKNCDSARRLDTTYDISGSLDIRDEIYREIKNLFLSDPFSITIEQTDTFKKDSQTLYKSTVASRYDQSLFKMIRGTSTAKPMAYEHIKCFDYYSPNFDKTIEQIVKDIDSWYAVPLLVSQLVYILRMMEQLSDIQATWKDADIMRGTLWHLRNSCRQQKY